MRHIIVCIIEQITGPDYSNAWVKAHVIYRGSDMDRAMYIARFCGGLVYEGSGIVYNARTPELDQLRGH